MATTKVAQPSQKKQKTPSYACHICGLNGHKMIDCLKFAEMWKMFHGKFVTIIEVQPIVETQTIITIVNVVDVSVTTRSRVIEEQLFKDRKLRKENSVVD
jgi:hypothetical protein